MKLKKAKNDVNFLRNLGINDLPDGFGAFQSSTEIDFLTKVQGGQVKVGTSGQIAKAGPQDGDDLSKLDRRETAQEITASRVIDKFNKNSYRILAFTNKQQPEVDEVGKIGKTDLTWANIQHEVMTTNYQEKEWYINLEPNNKKKIDQLRQAQEGEAEKLKEKNKKLTFGLLDRNDRLLQEANDKTKSDVPVQADMYKRQKTGEEAKVAQPE